MNAIPISIEIYLDANFLVAYLLSSHADSQKAQKLFAKLLISKNKLVFSALGVDETMQVIKKTLQSQESTDNLKKGKNYKDYISDIRQAVNILINDPTFRVTQFKDPVSGCSHAVDNIDNYILRPRDAFHLSYMQDQEIEYIVTNDRKFDGVKTIKRVSF